MDESQRRNLEIAYISLRLKGQPFGEAELTRELLNLDRVFSDSSLPSIVMDSKRIVAVVKRIDFEQTSKRFVVTFCATGSNEEETIRSERTDGRRGEIARSLWARQDLIGHRVVLYRHNEPSSDPKMSSGFRVAPWVTDLEPGKRSEREQGKGGLVWL